MNQTNPKYTWRTTLLALLTALSLLIAPLAPLATVPAAPSQLAADTSPPRADLFARAKELSGFQNLTALAADFYNNLFTAQPAAAQTEICGNGLDDDGDGYIDGYDSDCYTASACSVPAPPASFGMGLDWQSSNNVWKGSTPTVADLDGDGISEILVTSTSWNGYYVYEGDGSNQSSATLDYQIDVEINSTTQPAIADLDDDGTPEVVIVDRTGFVYIFNNVSGDDTSNFLYKSTTASQYTFGTPFISDLDEDGTPEIVVGNDIFGIVGVNLVKLVAGTNFSTANATGGSGHTPADVVPVDILPGNPGKELVWGSRVYGFDLGAGTMTVLKDLSTIPGSGAPSNDGGPTVVGDLDLDGDLDVAYGGASTFFMWDPNDDALLHSVSAGGRRGLPMLANFYDEVTNDGMGQNLPEVVLVRAAQLVAYNLNFTGGDGKLWETSTNDGSGTTSITAFDLNGDGTLELIYRDEINLRIFNGNVIPTQDYTTVPSSSNTWGEHPVVVDVDNDGSAEIVVTGDDRLSVYQSQ